MTELRYEYVPPSSTTRLDHVGTYKRNVPVSLERMYENALDWEHLPHLHASSFGSLTWVDSGAWGWRAYATNAKGQESLLELRLDESARRWITTNLEGPSAGAEIWTHVFEVAPRSLDLVIDFFVPGVPLEAREKVGMAYARAYEVLYDEDVWMMSERQKGLDQRLDAVEIGSDCRIATPAPEDLPMKVEVANRTYHLNRYREKWVVHPALCPHQLGPLSAQIDGEGRVSCPWHGYQFDVESGECVEGSRCQFGRRPAVAEVGDALVISFRE